MSRLRFMYFQSIIQKMAVAIACLLCLVSTGFSQAQSDHKQDLSQMFPLDTTDINYLRQKVEQQQENASILPGAGNDPGYAAIYQTSLNPGYDLSHPVINIGLHKITSIILTDSQGNILPIDSYLSGDPQNFSVTWPNNKGGVLFFAANKAFQSTNIAIMLKGEQVPLMITLISGQKTWHSVNYVRLINKDDASNHHLSNMNQVPEYLMNLLVGLPPKGAKALQIIGGDGATRVWDYNGQYLILTPDTLLSPQWVTQSSNHSSSGQMHAYVIAPITEILLSAHGQVMHLHIKNQGDLL